MRLLPIGLLLAVIGCLVSPFLFTAWLREHRGLEIRGTVTRKQEIVWHSQAFENDITRNASVTVSYFPPGQSWSIYKTVAVPLERYDQINRGDVLQMRYLLEGDLPNIPLLHSLYRSGFLPVASVDGRSVFGIWRDLLSELPVPFVCGAAASISVLWLWYRLRIPGRVIAIAVCIIGALGAAEFSEIPRPMSPLGGVVLPGRARVQNEWTVNEVFVGRRSNSSWSLNQPVQYVVLEFIPEGRREPVVTADNIDAGSIRDLKIGQFLAINYEQDRPRNTRLVEGTRAFWKENLRGLGITGVIWIVLGGLAVLLWVGISRKRRDSQKAATSS